MRTDYQYTIRSCYLGYITQAITNNLAPLLFVVFREEFGISLEMIGRLILVNFGTQILADFLAMRYADRLGYRASAVIAHACSAAGLVCLGVLPFLTEDPYLALTAAVVIYAVGGGIIEVLISPIVDALPGDAKASAMSLLHSFYCWGQVTVVLVSTVIIKILGRAYWPVLPLFWALVPLYNLFRFTRSPLAPHVAEHERTPLRTLFADGRFVVALVLMVCAGASELTMAQWSSYFAEKGLGVDKLLGDLLGPCLFAVFMGTGRAIYGVLGHRLPLKGAMLACAALCVICYAVAVLSPVPVVSLLGCALCGLSVSLLWPGTFSLSSAAFPKGGTLMFGLLAVCGDLGASLGPWLAGAAASLVAGSSAGQAGGLASAASASETFGLKVGLGAAAIFPVILFASLAAWRRRDAARDAPPVG